jgi:hypothetical protein
MCRGGRGNVKDKYSFMLAVCFLVSLVFLGANQSQNPQWKGTIEEEDGVKVIKNPREPLYGEITFDLEEDLSIGNETYTDPLRRWTPLRGSVYTLFGRCCDEAEEMVA